MRITLRILSGAALVVAGMFLTRFTADGTPTAPPSELAPCPLAGNDWAAAVTVFSNDTRYETPDQFMSWSFSKATKSLVLTQWDRGIDVVSWKLTYDYDPTTSILGITDDQDVTRKYHCYADTPQTGQVTLTRIDTVVPRSIPARTIDYKIEKVDGTTGQVLETVLDVPTEPAATYEEGTSYILEPLG